MARLELAKRMGVADGTLGRIKYGKANPTLDVVDQIASYYRIPAWRLIQPARDRVKEDPACYSEVVREIIELVSAMPAEKQHALLCVLEPAKPAVGSVEQ